MRRRPRLGEGARPRSRPTPSSAPRATAPTTSTTRSRRRAPNSREPVAGPDPGRAVFGPSACRASRELRPAPRDGKKHTGRLRSSTRSPGEGLAYGDLACRVVTGNARTDKANLLRHPTDEALSRDSEALLPVAAARRGGRRRRSIYSFCMCPGGKSFPPSAAVGDGRQRHVLLVAHSLLASGSGGLWGRLSPCLINRRVRVRVLDFQRSLERKAAVLGGGDYVCPVHAFRPDRSRQKSASSKDRRRRRPIDWAS